MGLDKMGLDKMKLTDEEFYGLQSMGVPFEFEKRGDKLFLVSQECIIKKTKDGYKAERLN